MRPFRSEHVYSHPWQQVTMAFWRKYPNEHIPHVLHCDVLTRTVDAKTGVLRTERLLTCSQPVPSFIKRIMGDASVTYIYEVSEVDPVNQNLSLRSVNLTCRNLLTVSETCNYQALGPNANETLFKQGASFTSFSGLWYIANALEEFCVERFRANAMKGRAALETVLNKIRAEKIDL